ncbi:MAG: hypothetical protein HOD43_14610 [Candidatus Marinimicrobia bacterium]|jgi:hypothetical protein|nr:hypothetical protein [Candidatus Neomarinimicrobiota bacterium]MBT3631962.1 hypothetical protein [Candidatus Neomarinimicrobiota bacterium]MBT3824548.1 hypothetical protein [Candidatus Neomarinimicrobiota bacterium]MBT4130277.1 hypothetical protein [Candidatus Neomarinimicrobiota bacterium]MBT4297028.1 hypothetical protein [Candidatus Neomarinimicrobiota bacterium]
MKHIHLLWIILVLGFILFNCSGSENLATSDQQTLRLPGMPAPADSAEFLEPDGLIGVETEESSKSYNVLDSILVAPN